MTKVAGAILTVGALGCLIAYHALIYAHGSEFSVVGGILFIWLGSVDLLLIVVALIVGLVMLSRSERR